MKKGFNRYNTEYIKIEYKIIGKNDVNDFLDKKFEEIANQCGLEFWGSGYNLKTKMRDLEFGSSFYKKQN